MRTYRYGIASFAHPAPDVVVTLWHGASTIPRRGMERLTDGTGRPYWNMNVEARPMLAAHCQSTEDDAILSLAVNRAALVEAMREGYEWAERQESLAQILRDVFPTDAQAVRNAKHSASFAHGKISGMATLLTLLLGPEDTRAIVEESR